ncbi:MAG TPA: bifunctional phosphoglucose/phosphomannose isomerase [Solirubrobacterales bacterium]|nr:bifunctional phosphoglucose/phosphomannose isomerase [Solirubrobacterales bacterium]
MLEDVLAIPEHLRDALWRTETARLEPCEADGLLICGVGGSAIGGDLAIAALGDRLSKPLITVRGYELPLWATADWTALCISYSGETAETLACFEAAGELGMRRVAVTTGGALVQRGREAGVPVVGLPGILQAPRSAVAYVLVATAEVAALCGAAPRIHNEIEAAAVGLESQLEGLRSRAATLAASLDGTLPTIVGSGPTVPAARRWKTQANENAKLPAFFSELPEADHNELCGWGGAPEGTRLSVVLLEDGDQDPREQRRFELTAQTIEAEGVPVERVATEGETRTERLLSGVILGDLVSLALAEKRGVDPLPIEAIADLKDALGRS